MIGRRSRGRRIIYFRQEPANFKPDYLSGLRTKLTQALSEFRDDDQLMFELAFVILQNCPGLEDVVAAQRLLAKVRQPYVHRPGDVESLRQLCEGMRLRLSARRPDFVVEKVNWAVTNECPMVCRGCYHPFTDSRLEAEEAKVIADKLISHGSQYVVLSGGDPLLWDPLVELVCYLNDNELKVAVDTTGYTMDDNKLGQLAAAVTLLRIPLDGSTDAIHRSFRRTPFSNPVERVLGLLQMCEERGLRCVILHTVVSRRNISDLENIASIAASYGCVNEWVLFQWCPRRAVRKLAAEMLVSEDRIRLEIDRVARKFTGLSIYFAACDDRAMINFFIQSDGQVVTFGSGWSEELIVGNILTQEMSAICRQAGVDHSAIKRGLIGGLSDH
jgi:MoaA/NifB/PqqE/SkfB family radical SAM enzyme